MIHLLLPAESPSQLPELLSFGTQLYRTRAVTFHVLLITEASGSAQGGDHPAETSNRELGEIKKSLSGGFGFPKHRYKVADRKGPFVPVVTEVARKITADLILIAAKEPGGAPAELLGSKRIGVLQQANGIPVLAIPVKTDYQPPIHLLFLTNFKRKFIRRELLAMNMICSKNQGRITVGQLVPDNRLGEFQRVNKDYLKEILYGIPLDFETIDSRTFEPELVKQLSQKVRADVLALVNHRYNFFQNLIQGDTIQRVMFECDVPLLILPELAESKLFEAPHNSER